MYYGLRPGDLRWSGDKLVVCSKALDERFSITLADLDAREFADEVTIESHGRGVRFPSAWLPPRYADLRGRSIPELPEAAARDGIAFLASVKDKDGREKVVLQAAPPSLVRDFLEGRVVPSLKGHYGDPARGFAGAHVS